MGYEPDVAMGVLMVACAPGGGISNTCAYLVEGEICLSIAMTFFSTAIAIGKNCETLFCQHLIKNLQSTVENALKFSSAYNFRLVFQISRSADHSNICELFWQFIYSLISVANKLVVLIGTTFISIN